LKIADLEKDDYVSSIRNKLLAESFYLMGDIKRYGTGFVRIRRMLKEKYTDLSHEINETGDFFIARLIHHPSKSVPHEGINEGISEGLKKLCQYIEENPGKRVPEISADLNISSKTLERWIKAGKESGRIKFQGSKRTGGYVIA